ncbi:MAG: aminopeptidase [Deltaproteobacteria bacterium]|nr:aminopeptidase [Deltaproteobacteria bacterium]
MQNDSLAFGAKQAVENCVKVTADDRVVIITDQQSKNIGVALKVAASRITDHLKFFTMEDFGPRPSDGSTPLAFPDALRDIYASWATVSFYAASGKKGELKAFRHPMLEAVKAAKLRHAHMVGVTEEMMNQGMAADYVEIKKVTHAVYDIAKSAKEIRVTTPAGSNLVATFDPKLKWVPCTGEVTSQKWTNLPDGETFTCPRSVDGYVVVDGVLGDFFSEKYGSLEKNPISFELKNGWVVKDSLRCELKELEQEFRSYLDTDENASRIGEFAIGTNIGLTKLIGNMLQDEKFPGIHMAVGNPYPLQTGADWSSDAHCDGVLCKTTIEIDGCVIMEKGKFCL